MKLFAEFLASVLTSVSVILIFTLIWAIVAVYWVTAPIICILHEGSYTNGVTKFRQKSIDFKNWITMGGDPQLNMQKDSEAS